MKPIVIIAVSIVVILLIIQLTKKSSPIMKLLTSSEPNPYHILGNGLLQVFNGAISIVKSLNIQFPLFPGCQSGNIDNIPVCGISFSGDFEAGGTGVCETAHGSCVAACLIKDVKCALCQATPFSCNAACKDIYDPCTAECSRGRSGCKDQLRGRWSTVINSLLNLGSLSFKSMKNFETYPREVPSVEIITFDIEGEVKLSVNATIDSSFTPSHTGNISLGNVKFILHAEARFDCNTNRFTTIRINSMEIEKSRYIF